MTETPPCFDEMLKADGTVRAAYDGFCNWYNRQDPGLMRRKGQEAES